MGKSLEYGKQVACVEYFNREMWNLEVNDPYLTARYVFIWRDDLADGVNVFYGNSESYVGTFHIGHEGKKLPVEKIWEIIRTQAIDELYLTHEEEYIINRV